MASALRGIFEFQRATQRVGGFGQAAGSLLDLRHVIERRGGVVALPGDREGLGLSEQCSLIVRSPGHGGRIFHQRLFEVAQPQENAAEAGMRKSS